MMEEDLSWLWAAYRKGAFEYMGKMDKDEFIEAMLANLGGATPFLLFAPVTGRTTPTPVGISVVYPRGHLLEVHLAWFPWSSARNKLEAVAKFIYQVRLERDVSGLFFKMFIASDRDSIKFWNHLMEYNLVGRSGWFPRFYANGDAMIYYSKDAP